MRRAASLAKVSLSGVRTKPLAIAISTRWENTSSIYGDLPVSLTPTALDRNALTQSIKDIASFDRHFMDKDPSTWSAAEKKEIDEFIAVADPRRFSSAEKGEGVKPTVDEAFDTKSHPFVQNYFKAAIHRSMESFESSPKWKKMVSWLATELPPKTPYLVKELEPAFKKIDDVNQQIVVQETAQREEARRSIEEWRSKNPGKPIPEMLHEWWHFFSGEERYPEAT
eukprot:TRINITY_DN49255_c0_g1_i1.p1 TRINITY_DN49255_c0_g1~~TRINITY_DN49255_c0_g1_i1.p1  ORF type:complete len:234 (-),score=55.27 TRINITY_DN49255_c0_g1_i1:61-735(-)